MMSVIGATAGDHSRRLARREQPYLQPWGTGFGSSSITKTTNPQSRARSRTAAVVTALSHEQRGRALQTVSRGPAPPRQAARALGLVTRQCRLISVLAQRRGGPRSGQGGAVWPLAWAPEAPTAGNGC